ncbi:hypothetical protein BVRB_8g190930 [Beta vulgaris subsp. vulgaris]|uniref:uncharacterized protein LOC104901671 n=1 Tax=Beta vulgaris subsp. vulgaris TaxID=3555 RepID=UPI00053F6EB8|nr:uncharacterized protein LOC104901671 [Beta vulgaris subsp. vulgaris]XP_057247306.1 uncharacterized protein LOC104901671 [Beta vulgaris subsp. vulgaris]KMT03405.1 hypothetical protein BVRB_8g190930 [Beta vulgaris subsp. vulgaris]
MEEQGGGNVSGIRQIGRLTGYFHIWQNAAINSRMLNHHDQPPPGGIPPEVNRRLQNSAVAGDSDEEGCASPEPPPDVPKGFLAVYVGPELRRFLIRTDYLSHHLFKVLLEKTEEEFGFDHAGGLTIPCEIETFKYLLNCIKKENSDKEGSSSNTVGESA